MWGKQLLFQRCESATFPTQVLWFHSLLESHAPKWEKKTALDIFDGVNSRYARKVPQEIWKTAVKKMDMLDAAVHLADLRAPPANHLKELTGKRKGLYAIRINDQYRLIFSFKESNAFDVDITDYH